MIHILIFMSRKSDTKIIKRTMMNDHGLYKSPFHYRSHLHLSGGIDVHYDGNYSLTIKYKNNTYKVDICRTTGIIHFHDSTLPPVVTDQEWLHPSIFRFIARRIILKRCIRDTYHLYEVVKRIVESKYRLIK